MTTYHLRGTDGTEVFTGTIQPPPGGGSQPGVSIVRGPFVFGFDTPGLSDGVSFYTPTPGDLLLDFWIEVDTQWDGTTPSADVGFFTSAERGFLGDMGVTTLDMSQTDDDGYFPSGIYLVNVHRPTGYGTSVAAGFRFFPGLFLPDVTPLGIVVSQDGLAGSDPPGATQGAAKVYIATATPAAFS